MLGSPVTAESLPCCEPNTWAICIGLFDLTWAKLSMFWSYKQSSVLAHSCKGEGWRTGAPCAVNAPIELRYTVNAPIELRFTYLQLIFFSIHGLPLISSSSTSAKTIIQTPYTVFTDFNISAVQQTPLTYIGFSMSFCYRQADWSLSTFGHHYVCVWLTGDKYMSFTQCYKRKRLR